MTRDTFGDLCAIAALIVALVAVYAVATRRAQRPFLTSQQAFTAAALVAVGSAAGSLLMSDLFDAAPCALCWWQRIFMYPLGILLPIAVVRRDATLVPWATILASVGLAFSVWHSIGQRFISLLGDSCAVGESCATTWVKGLGMLTIPNMALIGFASILALLMVARQNPAHA